MNANQLRTAAELSASSADLSAHDTAILANWSTSKITVAAPIETVAAYLRANGITADGTPETYAALAHWGKHYCRIVNYRPSPKTPEFAAAAGIVAETYTPPKRVRATRVATVDVAGDTPANPFDAVTFADNPPHTDGDTATAVATGKRAKRRAKRGEFRDAAVTGNPADFAAE